MMIMKIEELKKIPYRIIIELEEVKRLEEESKKKLMLYREIEKDIEEAYEALDILIENWNEAILNKAIEGLPEDFPF